MKLYSYLIKVYREKKVQYKRDKARDRVIKYLGDSAILTSKEEEEILKEWSE